MECLLTGTSRHNPAPLIDGGLWRVWQPGEYGVVLCYGCLVGLDGEHLERMTGRFKQVQPPEWAKAA